MEKNTLEVSCMRTCVVGFQSFLSVFSCNDLCMPSWDFLCQQHGFSHSPHCKKGYSPALTLLLTCI